jgi:hypothetical protein
MLSPDYGMSDFLKFKCVPWMWQILHIFLFMAYFYSAATTCVNKGRTKEPNMVEVYRSHYACPSCILSYSDATVNEPCNTQSICTTHFKDDNIKLYFYHACVYICIHKILKIKIYLPVHY